MKRPSPKRSASSAVLSTGPPSTILSSGSSGSKTPTALQTAKEVGYGRWLVVVGLMAVAGGLVGLAFYLSQQSQYSIAQGRFDSVAERALVIASLRMEEKKYSADALAYTAAAAAGGEANVWPNVKIPNYRNIAKSLRDVTQGEEMIFAPIVHVGEEQTEFEAFADGAHIWSLDKDGNKYHDTTGETKWNSPYPIVVPAFQFDEGEHKHAFINMHHLPKPGAAMDDIVRCSLERAAKGDSRECGSLTDFIWKDPEHEQVHDQDTDEENHDGHHGEDHGENTSNHEQHETHAEEQHGEHMSDHDQHSEAQHHDEQHTAEEEDGHHGGHTSDHMSDHDEQDSNAHHDEQDSNAHHDEQHHAEEGHHVEDHGEQMSDHEQHSESEHHEEHPTEEEMHHGADHMSDHEQDSNAHHDDEQHETEEEGHHVDDHGEHLSDHEQHSESQHHDLNEEMHHGDEHLEHAGGNTTQHLEEEGHHEEDHGETLSSHEQHTETQNAEQHEAEEEGHQGDAHDEHLSQHEQHSEAPNHEHHEEEGEGHHGEDHQEHSGGTTTFVIIGDENNLHQDSSHSGHRQLQEYYDPEHHEEHSEEHGEVHHDAQQGDNHNGHQTSSGHESHADHSVSHIDDHSAHSAHGNGHTGQEHNSGQSEGHEEGHHDAHGDQSSESHEDHSAHAAHGDQSSESHEDHSAHAAHGDQSSESHEDHSAHAAHGDQSSESHEDHSAHAAHAHGHGHGDFGGPEAIFLTPVYPQHDDSKLTGFVAAKLIWEEVLAHGFASDVTGLAIILETNSQVHTFDVTNGMVKHHGQGDHHDPNAQFQMGFVINNPTHYNDHNVRYHMTIYSTDEFMESYSVSQPWIFLLAAILLVPTLLFFLYDFYVRREFDAKRNLMEAKRQFVRVVSHEVRTPLNTVCMGMTLLRDDLSSCLGIRNQNKNKAVDGTMAQGQNSEQLEEWLLLSNQVAENAEAAVNILTDLLNYDKIQMGTLSLDLTAVPIWRLVEKTFSEFKIAAMEKKVGFEIDFSELVKDSNETDDIEAVSKSLVNQSSKLPPDVKDCIVLGDTIRLSQVLRNLISNGLKFIKQGGKLTVRVSEKIIPKKERRQEEVKLENDTTMILTRKSQVVINVVDDGVGMTPEQVRTVFQDGTQFNANKLQSGGGSGLGLNIAKGIAEQHNGSLNCSSAGIGEGTTFTLCLPLYQVDSNDSAPDEMQTSYNNEEGVPEEISMMAALPEDLQILVVDDSAMNRKLCMRLLEKHGHKCTGAEDGKEALEIVRQCVDQFDCILLDYEMPNLNGPDACKEMRNIGCSSFIVGVTGNVMSEDLDHFRECGANWVLAKPFRIEALEQQLVENGIIGSVGGGVMVAVDSDGSAESNTSVTNSASHSNFSSLFSPHERVGPSVTFEGVNGA